MALAIRVLTDDQRMSERMVQSIVVWHEHTVPSSHGSNGDARLSPNVSEQSHATLQIGQYRVFLLPSDGTQSANEIAVTGTPEFGPDNLVAQVVLFVMPLCWDEVEALIDEHPGDHARSHLDRFSAFCSSNALRSDSIMLLFHMLDQSWDDSGELRQQAQSGTPTSEPSPSKIQEELYRAFMHDVEVSNRLITPAFSSAPDEKSLHGAFALLKDMLLMDTLRSQACLSNRTLSV